MVARTKIIKIISPLGEIQQTFKEEIKVILEAAALKMGCNIEQLKYRFDNLGRVEVQKMTIEEMVEKRNEDEERKRAAVIRNRGNNENLQM